MILVNHESGSSSVAAAAFDVSASFTSFTRLRWDSAYGHEMIRDQTQIVGGRSTALFHDPPLAPKCMEFSDNVWS